MGNRIVKILISEKRGKGKVKKYKGIIQRLGAVSLALAMTAVALVPAYGQTESAGDAAADTEITAEEEKSDPASADEKQPEDQEQKTADKAAKANETDITPPMVEKVELLQSGKSVKPGDTLELYVDANDADSGIASVFGLISDEDGDTRELVFAYDSENDRYVGTYTLEDYVGNGAVFVSRLQVTDNNGNYTDFPVGNSAPYAAAIVGGGADTVEPMSVSLEQNHQVLKQEDPIEMSLTLGEETGVESFYASFKDGDGIGRALKLSRQQGMVYSCSEVYGGTGRVTLQDIRGSRLGADLTVSIDNPEDFYFDYETEEGEEPEDPSQDMELPVITSVTMDKMGQIVCPGDQVTVTVKAEDNQELASTGSATFYAVAKDILDDSRSITLRYDQEKQAYTGVLEITEDMYPCEWYLRLSIHDAAGNEASDELVNGVEMPYYIQVYNGDTFVNPTYDTVTVSFYELGADGKWQVTDTVTKENVERRATFREAGIEFPEMKAEYPGLTRTGWEFPHTGEEITEDTEIAQYNSTNRVTYLIYAQYDKFPVEVNYWYMGDSNSWVNDTQVYLAEEGITYGELYETAAQYVPENLYQKELFSQWDSADSEEEIPAASSLIYQARYAEKKAILVAQWYYDERGLSVEPYSRSDAQMAILVDEDSTAQEIKELLDAQEMPAMYEGLRFDHWEYPGLEQTVENNANWNLISMEAAYENCIVSYYVDPEYAEGYIITMGMGKDPEAVFAQAVEPGETVTIPDSLGKYKDITWVINPAGQEANTLVVNENEEFFGYPGSVEEDPADPEEPTDPEDPEDPNEPENPAVPETPGEDQGTELPGESVDSLVEQIKNAAAGETVSVAMGDATVVSKEMLEAAKGKDVDLVLNMGGYSWTINGQNITAKYLKDINLQVKLNTNAIPSSTVSKLAGDNPTYQLSLAHEGDFGFRASLTFNIGSQYAGKYGNLYYYDSDGKMVFISSGVIGEDGEVSLNFSHASDYVVVISQEKMSQADVPEEINPSESAGNQSGSQQEAPATEDVNPILPLTVLMLLAGGAALGAALKLKGQRR